MNPDDPRPTELEEASAKFQASLEQCRHMVADYRTKLAASAGKPTAPVAANDTGSESES